MQWKCPHCKITLTVTKRKINKGWNFTRCTQCNGYSVVKSSVEYIPLQNKLPNPLPEVKTNRSSKSKLLPISMALAGIIAIISGFHLYQKGTLLWSQARNQMAMHTDQIHAQAMAPIRQLDRKSRKK